MRLTVRCMLRRVRLHGGVESDVGREGSDPVRTPVRPHIRGTAGAASAGQAGASVRTAQRRRADRAGGLAAISTSPAFTGLWLTKRKLGSRSGAAPGGKWREP